MKHCWVRMREGKLFECSHSRCCYDQSAKSVYAYWEYAHSDEWKNIIKDSLYLKEIDEIFFIVGIEDMERLE